MIAARHKGAGKHTSAKFPQQPEYLHVCDSSSKRGDHSDIIIESVI